MTDQLPTIESLDEAARAAGWHSWGNGGHVHISTRLSIIAHARTLDELHNRTPVDPLREPGHEGQEDQRAGGRARAEKAHDQAFKKYPRMNFVKSPPTPRYYSLKEPL